MHAKYEHGRSWLGNCNQHEPVGMRQRHYGATLQLQFSIWLQYGR